MGILPNCLYFGGTIMILITILALIAIMATAVVLVTVAAGGAAFLIIFADVIVCVFLIVWLIRKICKRK